MKETHPNFVPAKKKSNSKQTIEEKKNEKKAHERWKTESKQKRVNLLINNLLVSKLKQCACKCVCTLALD